jgi:hypothetical protein
MNPIDIQLMRVNSTNVLDEGLRIGGDRASDELEGKVSQTRCVSKINVRCKPGLLSICLSPSSQVNARSQGSGGVRYRLQYRHTT